MAFNINNYLFRIQLYAGGGCLDTTPYGFLEWIMLELQHRFQFSDFLCKVNHFQLIHYTCRNVNSLGWGRIWQEKNGTVWECESDFWFLGSPCLWFLNGLIIIGYFYLLLVRFIFSFRHNAISVVCINLYKVRKLDQYSIMIYVFNSLKDGWRGLKNAMDNQGPKNGGGLEKLSLESYHFLSG